MAKRFTDTDKWKKNVIKKMPPAYKLLWIYMCDDCDNAGIWHVDFDVAEIRIGEQISEEKAKEYFGDKIISIDKGEKWFIPGFIDFQYGVLNIKNRAHESVIKKLEKYDLLNEDLSVKDFSYKPLNKPLASPLQGAKDKDKVKEEEEDKDFEKSEKLLQNENLLIPEMLKIFTEKNKKYSPSKKRDYPELLQIATELNGLPIKEFSDCEKLKTRWGEVVDFIVFDDFFRNYSLAQINKHLQAILLSKENGKRTSKNIAKLSPSEARARANADY